jgi:hypothetical protein
MKVFALFCTQCAAVRTTLGWMRLPPHTNLHSYPLLYTVCSSEVDLGLDEAASAHKPTQLSTPVHSVQQ